MTGKSPILSDAPEVLNLKSTNRILIIALIISSFFLGSLTNKVSTLEKNGSNANTPSAATNQPQGAQPSAITKDTMKQWAKELGLNTNNFNSCLDSDKYKNAVDEDLKSGQTAGVNGTPTFFINGTILVGAQPYEAFKTIVDKELAQGTNSKNNLALFGQAFAQEIPLVPSQAPKVSVDNGHLPALGDKNAKVTIVEFSDFECPFCRRFFTDTLPQIKKDYIDSGRVVMYYRHYPLPFHPLAQPFAIASECANEQGKFWEFHDKIFQEQG